MAVLLAIAIPLAIYNFKDLFAGGSSAVTTAAAPSVAPPKAGGSAVSADSDPRLRLDILEASRRVKYEPGRNIFEMQELKIETPLTNARNLPNVHYGPDLPPPPPPPPPIPLKFYGFANRSGDPKKVFL